MDYFHRVGGDTPFGWLAALQSALRSRPRPAPAAPLRLAAPRPSC